MRHFLGFRQGINVDSHHSFTQVRADFCKNLRIVEVGHRLHNGVCALLWIVALEDAGADENAVQTQLHHHGRVCRSSDAARREVHHGQTTQVGCLFHDGVWRLNVLGIGEELILAHDGYVANLAKY